MTLTSMYTILPIEVLTTLLCRYCATHMVTQYTSGSIPTFLFHTGCHFDPEKPSRGLFKSELVLAVRLDRVLFPSC